MSCTRHRRTFRAALVVEREVALGGRERAPRVVGAFAYVLEADVNVFLGEDVQAVVRSGEPRGGVDGLRVVLDPDVHHALLRGPWRSNPPHLDVLEHVLRAGGRVGVRACGRACVRTPTSTHTKQAPVTAIAAAAAPHLAEATLHRQVGRQADAVAERRRARRRHLESGHLAHRAPVRDVCALHPTVVLDVVRDVFLVGTRVTVVWMCGIVQPRLWPQRWESGRRSFAGPGFHCYFRAELRPSDS